MAKFILISIIIIITLTGLTSCSNKSEEASLEVKNMKSNTADKEMINYVTKKQGTEPAFKNAYWDEKRAGIYVDVNTGEALFSSTDKYDSGTGWPSFTKPINKSKIMEEKDTSAGMTRTEVKTNASHLGHVFDDGPNGGERFCVNSAALRFVPYQDLEKEGYSEYKELFDFKEAYFGGGCFWGVEHLFSQLEGVIDVTSGYSGGDTNNPSYKEVSSGKTGHAETVKITYDPNSISYRKLVDYFWRVHDPTEVNRQGPDVGTQYRSVIFYLTEEEKTIAMESKDEFDAKKVFKEKTATQIVKFKEFYPAEDYHQDYVDNNPGYVCHALRDE